MNLSEFSGELGEAYACVGRPALEGRLVGLLLALPEPQSLGALAGHLGVSKAALLKVVRPMVERGDLKRWREPSSREHLLAITDHAYIHDLRVHVINSRRVLAATRTLLSARGLDEQSRQQLRRHAEVVEQAARCLEALIRPVEAEQNRDLQRHLSLEWDALPARRGRGRNPAPEPEPEVK